MGRSGTTWRGWGLGAVALLLSVFLVAACDQTQTLKAQAFKDLHRIDTDLVRGVSTRADVLILLGAPDGRGNWVYGRDSDPGGGGPREVWHYTSFNLSVTGGTERSLSVFFRGNLYDGYLWLEHALSVDRS